MGSATDFKVGVQNRIRERSERQKNLYPPLFQMWGPHIWKSGGGGTIFLSLAPIANPVLYPTLKSVAPPMNIYNAYNAQLIEPEQNRTQ